MTDDDGRRALDRQVRPVRIAAAHALLRTGTNGTVYLRSTLPLGTYPTRITERLEQWADRAPDRSFLAERDVSGAWRSITDAGALARVRRVAQALIDRGLSRQRPVVIQIRSSGQSSTLGRLPRRADESGGTVVGLPVE